jgi:hypothetical protein
MGSAMNRLDPLIEELEEVVESELQNYRNAGGSPQRVMAWWVDYLTHMVKAQPQKLRDEIKSVVHKRICEMD